MTDITMPQLSDAMEEGTIVKWLVDDGAEVAIGDELVEVETDKATMAHPADAEGSLRIVVPEGENARVGQVIATIGEPATGTTPDDGADPPTDTATDAEPEAEPAAEAAPSRSSSDGDRASSVTTAGGDAAVATPVARRAAAVHEIDLDDLNGTGPRGRITKTDVLRHAGIAPDPVSTTPEPAPAPAPGPASAGADATSTRQPTRLQLTIARRMAEATSTVPHFQVQTEVDMTEAVALRARLRALVGEDERPPSFNDMIVRACALALREHPLANGSWVDETFALHDRVNVGIAVAADDGLVVPTIHDTDHKTLGQIGRESRRLAAAVRDGTVSAAELSGGTFTVSNLGMYGMTAITPVINPPQAAILGVGAVRDTLARIDGEIVDRPLMTLTLSCDHRILYGAGASLFLKRVRDLLEQPLRIAL